MLAVAPFKLEILPSAMMDIARTQYFYDSLERGLGMVFRDHLISEVDKLVDDAGVDEKSAVIRSWWFGRLPNYRRCRLIASLRQLSALRCRMRAPQTGLRFISSMIFA